MGLNLTAKPRAMVLIKFVGPFGIGSPALALPEKRFLWEGFQGFTDSQNDAGASSANVHRRS